MPQRLMLAPLPDDAETGSGNPDGPEADVYQDLRILRRQVWEVIDSVLNGNAPEAVRNNLKRYISRNPGRPERALLQHLMSLPGLADAAPGA